MGNNSKPTEPCPTCGEKIGGEVDETSITSHLYHEIGKTLPTKIMIFYKKIYRCPDCVTITVQENINKQYYPKKNK